MHWPFWLAAQIRACLASGHQLRLQPGHACHACSNAAALGLQLNSNTRQQQRQQQQQQQQQQPQQQH